MRVADAGEGEGRATVAAYDWLAGCGETSSGLSSSLGSTGSSLESNSLYEQGGQNNQQLFKTYCVRTGSNLCSQLKVHLQNFKVKMHKIDLNADLLKKSHRCLFLTC